MTKNQVATILLDTPGVYIKEWKQRYFTLAAAIGNEIQATAACDFSTGGQIVSVHLYMGGTTGPNKQRALDALFTALSRLDYA